MSEVARRRRSPRSRGEEAPATPVATPDPSLESVPEPFESGSLARSLRSTRRAPGPGGQMLADVPHRVVALLIDMIVVGIVGILVVATIGSALGGVITPRTLDSAGGDLDLVPFAIVLLIVLALSLAYFAVGWTRWQATLGKRLLGLTLLADDGGHRLTASQAATRWLLVGIPATIATLPTFVPSLIAVILAVLGLIALVGLLVTIGQDPARQGLHDRYAGSIVTTVSRRRPASSA